MKVGTVILQVKKLRHKRGLLICLSHRDIKWQSLDLNLGSLAPVFVTAIPTSCLLGVLHTVPVTALSTQVVNILGVNSIAHSLIMKGHNSFNRLPLLGLCPFFLYHRMNSQTGFESVIRMYQGPKILKNLVLCT